MGKGLKTMPPLLFSPNTQHVFDARNKKPVNETRDPLN